MIKDRIKLAEHFNDLGFKRGAEIGVADGRYAEILCQKIPGLHLTAVDPWIPYEGNWRSQDYQQKAYERAVERLTPFKANIVRKTGIEASLDVPDKSLDFVFIDGNHYFDYIMEDIITWSRKVRKGGIVSGHDYYEFRSGGIIKAVDAYVEAHDIDLELTMHNPGGHQDDQAPCWFFVKE